VATANTLKMASVLAFERKLDPSDALFFSGNWNSRADSANWPAVGVREKSVRGTISNRLKTTDADPAKLDAAIQNPNLQTVDVAALPAEADTLKLTFTLRVLGGAGIPSACNSADYQAKLLAAVSDYVKSVGFAPLAKRYAANLANGRFLWRNRVGAEEVEVQVTHLVAGRAAQSWTFDALALDLRHLEAAPVTHAKDLGAIAELIAAGLSGQRHLLLQVTAYARIGAGQEVFPSQELILDKEKAGKSKTLYAVNGIAGMHSQKIGNALRTIDTWYPGHASDQLGPIAVEPYGSVTTMGRACRQPKAGTDFYTLFDNWLLGGRVPEPEQQHYVIATLIRGGVFGASSQE